MICFTLFINEFLTWPPSSKFTTTFLHDRNSSVPEIRVDFKSSTKLLQLCTSNFAAFSCKLAWQSVQFLTINSASFASDLTSNSSPSLSLIVWVGLWASLNMAWRLEKAMVFSFAINCWSSIDVSKFRIVEKSRIYFVASQIWMMEKCKLCRIIFVGDNCCLKRITCFLEMNYELKEIRNIFGSRRHPSVLLCSALRKARSLSSLGRLHSFCSDRHTTKMEVEENASETPYVAHFAVIFINNTV